MSRDDTAGNQEEAQRRLKVHPETHKDKYKGKPGRVSDQSSESDQMETLEENDYSGVRSQGDGKDLTEKSFGQTHKDKKESLHYSNNDKK